MGIITVVNGDHKEKYAEFPLIGLPVNSQVFPVSGADVDALPSLRLSHVVHSDSRHIPEGRATNRDPLHRPANHGTAHCSLSPPMETPSEETPSVPFSLWALLQAKIIKRNRVQMFESSLPTLRGLPHSHPYFVRFLVISRSNAINYHRRTGASGFAEIARPGVRPGGEETETLRYVPK